MKRNLSCNDSLTHFLSHPHKHEEEGEIGDKKRRLSNHQVKSLEKIFEVDSKLDPDRKVRVAQDLGLQPRQVAIWFQNRRARWKTKQLERDYTLLKSNYDALNHNYHKLHQHKQTMIKQLVELKAKLHDQTIKRNNNEKALFVESNPTNTEKILDLKDGFSDSDSSGVVNEENISVSNMLNMSSFGISNHTEFSDMRAYQHQSDDPYLVSNASAEDESCNIFLVDQPPNLCWYFQDHNTTG